MNQGKIIKDILIIKSLNNIFEASTILFCRIRKRKCLVDSTKYLVDTKKLFHCPTKFFG